jgi:D-threo-aldose 1-dehydrogenase
MIETRPLGRTGLPVSVLGFGAAPLGDLYARLDDETAVAAVAAARGAGMTLFDTSPHYGNGLSELRVGAGLRRQPGAGVVLSTKIGRVMDPRRRPDPPLAGVISPGFAGGVPHRASFDYSYDGALRAFEQSLLRLGVDRIDILLIHDVDVWTHGDGFEVRFKEAMDGAYRALEA